MKTSLLFKVAVLCVLLSGVLPNFSCAQNANEAESAKNFVENLYSRYGPNCSPPKLSGENADQFFATDLIQLAKTALATAGSRYSGALNYDHLCNRKDTNVTFPGLRISARSTTANQAVATVTFIGDDRTKNIILINLIRQADQWRIADIKDFTGPPPYTSLRAVLKEEIKAWSKVQPSH